MRTLLGPTAGALLLIAAGLPAATTYTITNLGVLPGQIGSTPTAINNAGQIVGQSFGSSALPFLWQNGTMSAIPGISNGIAQDINASGSVAVYDSDNDRAYVWDGIALSLIASGNPYGINNAGQVVGILSNSGVSFLWNGSLSNLPTFGGVSGGGAYAINNNGEVAGSLYRAVCCTAPPVIWTGAPLAPVDLGFGSPAPNPGSAGSAQDINDSGQATGITPIQGGVRAFLYSGGVMTTLGTLGGDMSQGLGINAGGAVVGLSTTTGFSNPRAFAYSGGTMIDLNTVLSNGAGWILTQATDINDQGWIVGEGTFNGARRAFLLTPDAANEVPEPSTWAMAGAGFALILARRLRQ